MVLLVRSVRRPALQGGEQQPGDNNNGRAKPNHHVVDATFEVRKPTSIFANRTSSRCSSFS
jgi:hypothetical protein